MIANCITIGRILFSLCLFILRPSSVPFAALYVLCGISDVLDGFLARKLHTESEKGAKLDSAADLFFAAAYAVKILPLLNLPPWILIWAAIIAAAKIASILTASREARGLSVAHSFGNKLTGLLLFFLPLSLWAADAKYGAALACCAATAVQIKERADRKRHFENETEKRKIKQ